MPDTPDQAAAAVSTDIQTAWAKLKALLTRLEAAIENGEAALVAEIKEEIALAKQGFEELINPSADDATDTTAADTTQTR